MNNGSVVTINRGDSIANAFQNAGLDVNIFNGRISITGDESHYITSMDNALKNALHIEVGEGYTYKKVVDFSIQPGQTSVHQVTTTGATQTSSSKVQYDIQTTALANSTFAQIGITPSGVTDVYDADGNFKGSFTVTSATTMSQFVN